MIKIQNSLQKLELDYLVLSNGECVYFAKTAAGAVKQFVKQQKEHFRDGGLEKDWKKKLVARPANKDQIESAVDSICEHYAMRYLRADQLRRSIERYCFVVDFN
jgi:hypothetical protein